MLPISMVFLGFGFWAYPNFEKIAAGIAVFLFGLWMLKRGVQTLSGGLIEDTLQKVTRSIPHSISYGVSYFLFSRRNYSFINRFRGGHGSQPRHHYWHLASRILWPKHEFGKNCFAITSLWGALAFSNSQRLFSRRPLVAWHGVSILRD